MEKADSLGEGGGCIFFSWGVGLWGQVLENIRKQMFGKQLFSTMERILGGFFVRYGTHCVVVCVPSLFAVLALGR